jgi:hypothetical protein
MAVSRATTVDTEDKDNDICVKATPLLVLSQEIA